MGIFNRNKEVLELDLSKQSLTHLSSEILKYSNLKKLDISGNKLTTLPDFLKDFQFLEVINVSDNELTQIPDYFFEFKYLTELYISNNKILSFPLTNNYYDYYLLKRLYIGDNPLKEIPAWVWKLKGLENLSIGNISLKELPEQIGNLRSLKSLSIDYCNLNSLPDAIGGLENLEELWASHNNLTTLPATFGNLKKIEVLNFYRNNFKRLPKIVVGLQSLCDIHLSKNGLEVLPENIGDAKNIEFIDLTDNNIKEFPDSFYTLNSEKTNIWFDNNPYLEETIARIKKTRSGINPSYLLVNDTSLEEDKIKAKELTPLEKAPIEISTSQTNSITFLILGIVAFFLIYYFVNLPNEVENRNTIIELEKEEHKLSLQAYDKMYQEVDNILARLNKIQIYTNDTVQLALKLDRNRNRNRDKDKLYANLNNKSYGYTVVLNNQKKAIKQLLLYDSIPPINVVKKFKVSIYYKESRLDMYGKNRYAVYEKEIDYNELKKGLPIVNLVPRIPIDLSNEDCFFYFSALNGNMSKDDFSDAIEKFNTVFIKKGNLEEHCNIQTVDVY